MMKPMVQGKFPRQMTAKSSGPGTGAPPVYNPFASVQRMAAPPVYSASVFATPQSLVTPSNYQPNRIRPVGHEHNFLIVDNRKVITPYALNKSVNDVTSAILQFQKCSAQFNSSHEATIIGNVMQPKKENRRGRQKLLEKRNDLKLEAEGKKAMGPATNRAVAEGYVRGKIHRFSGRSGLVGVPAGAHIVINGAAPVLPWDGLAPALPAYPFHNCAEAQVWHRIIEAGFDPGKFTITAYRPDNSINPPCANCALWVYATFKKVIDR